MSYRTQCTQTVLGARGSGASGSSTMSAKLRVSGGAPLHPRAGEWSSPSQVCGLGISPPGEKEVDESVSVDVLAVVSMTVLPVFEFAGMEADPLTEGAGRLRHA